NRIAEPKPNKGGDVILANFDAKAGPFVLSHCALVRLYRGDHSKGLTVWYPNTKTPFGRRGIRCDDREFAAAMKDAAAKVFIALGGEAEPPGPPCSIAGMAS